MDRPLADWLLTVQARAQHRDVKGMQHAMQYHSMAHGDTAGGDHQGILPVGRARVQEHEMNDRVLKELEKTIRVCALALSVRRPTTTSVCCSHPVSD